ncbi:MAG: TIM barrel protein [Clostridia bacterium]|nr:TIM barrel protein [Clostridia bacterium]
MKIKSIVSLFLVFILLFSAVTPACAAVSAADDASAASSGEDFFGSIAEFFKTMFESIKAFFDRIGAYFEVKREGVKKTMNKNAVHMLKSVTDTICDSFIITTEDGKVIVIDGGHRTETGYFIEYLKAVTGQSKPHIDVWFLSHAHDDHCEVFLEVVEKHSREITFDKVYANFPEASFYDGYDEWGVYIINEFNRLLPSFRDKTAELKEGDVFNVGAAKFTVFYTFNPEWRNVNEGSTIMRMDLNGKSFMFTGDAGVNAGNYVVGKYGESGILDCDICKMAHHGQDGVDRNFYEAVSPEICLWPTPSWVWDNRNGNLKTLEVRAWIDELGVKRNYVAKDGSFSMFISNPRIVTTTDVFEEGYSAEKAVDRLAGIGFEGIDMGFDYWVFDGSPFLSEGYLDWALSLKKRADKAGIPYTHAHAPGEADAGDVIGRSIEAASVLGAKYCVIHPVWKDENGKTIESKSKFISVNVEAIKKWLPLAEKCGVILLSENILWGASKDPRIISELVKEVDSKWFGWCFDVGHAHCSGFSPDVLRNCAVIPASLHIQDNDGSGDGHLIPGDGTIDWDKFIEILKEIGYTGDCVMEAHHQSLVAPDEERDAILKRLLSESEKLRTAMEY